VVKLQQQYRSIYFGNVVKTDRINTDMMCDYIPKTLTACGEND
jgi:hypothetical protein